MRRPAELDLLLTSPFSAGSPYLRLLLTPPKLEASVGPLAAASNADLQSSPDEGPAVLGLLSVHVA